MMLSHVIDFVVDYFTNLNLTKIIGGILILAGLALLGSMGASGNPEKAVWYAVGGLLVGGAGFVVVYYDISKDKADQGGYSELDTLAKAYKQDTQAKRKITAWGMNQDSNEAKTRKGDQ